MIQQFLQHLIIELHVHVKIDKIMLKEQVQKIFLSTCDQLNNWVREFLRYVQSPFYPASVHCKKKKCAMHTKYGVLRLSRLEHLIWREVTPNFWCVFYAKLGVLSH